MRNAVDAQGRSVLDRSASNHYDNADGKGDKRFNNGTGNKYGITWDMEDDEEQIQETLASKFILAENKCEVSPFI